MMMIIFLSIQWYRDTRALNLDSSRGGVSLENEKTPQVLSTLMMMIEVTMPVMVMMMTMIAMLMVIKMMMIFFAGHS